jgi:hypothetical protein
MVRTRVHLIRKLRTQLQSSGRLPIMVRTREALYGNYLQRTCDHPDDSASPSERGSQTGTIFQRKSQKFCCIVVRLDDSGSPSGRRPYILQQSPI